MLIYDVLKKDHDKLKGLLDRLVTSADATDAARAKLIEQIRDELVPHSRAEEAIFYNSLREIDETKGMVMHGYAEHMEAETMLRALQTQDAVNADWTKTAQKLRDSLYHHIAEEEEEIFGAARQVLAEEEAEMMAEVFKEMKPQIKEEGFMQTTIDMFVNIMPQRFGVSLRTFLASKH